MPTSILERPLRLFTVRHQTTDDVLGVYLCEAEAQAFLAGFGVKRGFIRAQVIERLGEPTPVAARKGGPR